MASRWTFQDVVESAEETWAVGIAARQQEVMHGLGETVLLWTF